MLRVAWTVALAFAVSACATDQDVVRRDAGAERGDLVFVSVQYRVGAFGFLSHPDFAADNDRDSTGNWGVMDQIAALEWVRDTLVFANVDGIDLTPEEIALSDRLLDTFARFAERAGQRRLATLWRRLVHHDRLPQRSVRFLGRRVATVTTPASLIGSARRRRRPF